MIRAISWNRPWGIASPQIQLKKYVSPTQFKFSKQAGRCWISQMYCFMFFQSVLDPIAHDYSQVQNCMHKWLRQQFTDCELNQPIVSTISCSLLIWKEPGRWLPLQLASCGQLSLLVQFCTLWQGMCKSNACLGFYTFGSKYPIWCPPTSIYTWTLEPGSWIRREAAASKRKDRMTEIRPQRMLHKPKR